MQIQRLDSSQQIQIIDENHRNVVQTYFKIPGTCPSFKSDMFPRKDRGNIRDLVRFLWEHCIDTYVTYGDRSYPEIDVLALARDYELYLMANAYFHTKINSPYPDRTLKIGKYVRGKGGEIKRLSNRIPEIRGSKFDVRLLSGNEFTYTLPKPYSALKLIPQGLFKGRTIDLVIVPEDYVKKHEKEENQKRTWQEWLKLGSDVHYVY